MSSKVLKWLVLTALLLLIVSFFSFWFSGPSFREKDIELKIEGPTQAAVGDEIVYKLKYSNDTKLKMYNLRFSFYYPQDSVVIKDGDILNDLSERFDIEQLDPGEKGEREFHAFIVGDKGDIKEAKVDLSFRAENLRSSFEKRAALSATITSVPVSLTIVAPPNVVPGDSIEYILDYRNESSNAIQDLLFEFTFPDGFAAKDFSPDPNSGNNKWHFDLLKKNGAGRIYIRGILSGKEGDAKTIEVSLKRKINGKYVNFEKASSFSTISSPLLNLDISVNGSKTFVANPGSELNYQIKYMNNSDFSLSGLTLSVKLDGDMYDLYSLDTKGGFFDNSKKTIVWGPSNVNDFSNLKPSANGTVEFFIKLKHDFDLGGSNTLFVKSSAKLGTSNVPEGVDGNEVLTSSNLVTNITKQPTLSQRAYFNDPSYGFTGSLPPKTGEETFFTVHWLITNPGNSFNNAVMSAKLPDGVSWKNIFSSNVSLEDPKFKNGELSWNIGTIPNGVGGLMPKYELIFRISVMLSEGENVSELLNNVQLSGVDSVTGQNIIIPGPDVEINDLND